MVDVSDLTIKAYTEYASSKSITIRFPNDSTLSPITNKNLQEESMKLTNSICEENFLQVQGCNASQFEITTFDIQTDLTGKDIVVYLSVRDTNYRYNWVSGAQYSVGNIVKYNGKYYQCYEDYVGTDTTNEVKSISNRGGALRSYYYNGYLTDNVKALKIVLPYLMEGVSGLLTVAGTDKNGNSYYRRKEFDSLDYVNYIDMAEYEHGENIQYDFYIMYQESEELVLERIQSDANIARGKDAYASSTRIEDAYLPSETVDGNLETRWASIDNIQDEPEQWIYIDLGEEKPIYDIAIYWEGAFATKYKIQTSLDGEVWTDALNKNTSKAETIDLLFKAMNFESIQARYVRIYCLEPFDYSWAYSIWELGIFDTIPDYLFKFKEFIYKVQALEVLDSTVKLNTIPPDDSRAEDYFQEAYGYLDTSQVPDSIIFRGRIDSFEKQSDPRYRNLIAYDKLYQASNVSIKSWINTVSSSGAGYIEKYNYRGQYDSSITNYKAGDSVSVPRPIYVNGIVVAYTNDYFVFLKDFTVPEYRGYPLAMIASDGYPGSLSGVDKGSTYVTSRDDYYPNRKTVKTLRNDLCTKLGIEQEEVTLPLDDVALTIGEFSDEVSGTQLLQWICNLNMVFGYIVPSTGKLRYIFINEEKKNISEDSNYKGFYIGQSVQAGNVLAYASEIDGTILYYRALMDTTKKAPTIFTANDVTNYIRNETDDGPVYFRPPSMRSEDWCIDFDWNPYQFNLQIVISEYAGPSGTNLNSITITSPSRVYLTDVLINNSHYTISVKNLDGEDYTLDNIKTTLYTCNGLQALSYAPDNEIVSAFWEQCNTLYHPSGRINLSNFYEADGVVLKDMDYKNLGYKVVDTSNNIVYGVNDDNNNNYINIIFSPLYNVWKEARNVYIDVQENVGYAQQYFTINYTPFTLSLLGLPFLEPGDYICFDVTEWSSDEDDNPVTTTKTINSIILNRTLSGLVALMDSLEAKYE